MKTQTSEIVTQHPAGPGPKDRRRSASSNVRSWSRRSAAWLALCAIGACAEGNEPETVPKWIRQHARPLAATEPAAPFDDLRSLGEMVADAEAVGLGESTHGAHEQFAVKHRLVRYLVQELGFRSLALEEDWTKGVQIDAYLMSGQGSPRALLADAGIPWRTEEILETLLWLRQYNEAHPGDPVRFVGLDIVAVRALAYEAVTEYVRRVAGDRWDELEGHLVAITPRGSIFEHIQRYRALADKEPLIEHAREAFNLVRGLPPTDGHALALQHARSIVSFYEYHAQAAVAFRDQRLAENAIWWRGHTGHRIVYWAANLHTANAPELTVSYPPFPPANQASAGSILRAHYGDRYRSIGMMFDSGSLNAGFAPVTAWTVASPPPEFVETAFADARQGDFFVDLRQAGSARVRTWLDAPAKTRLIGPSYDPAHDASYFMTGGSLAQWFDVVVYQTKVTPTRLLLAGQEDPS